MVTFRYSADSEARRVLLEKENSKLLEKEKEKEERKKKLERENTTASLNQDINYAKDSIKTMEETIREANGDLGKVLKDSAIQKEDVQRSHTFIQMSLENKRMLENTLYD